MSFLSPEAEKLLAALHPRTEITCIAEQNQFAEETPSLDLSVIVPCYNAEATLPSLLRDLDGQTAAFPWEALLVDDGSLDGTLPLLNRFAMGRRHVRVITKENGGAASARNAGIRASHGKYLMFVDADDAIPANYLDALMACVRGSDADMAACGFESRTEQGQLLRKCEPRNDADWTVINGCPWGKVFRRELFAHVRFPEGLWFEDTVLPFLIYPRVKRLRTTADCAYFYRSSPGNSTRRAMKNAKSLDTVYLTEAMLACAPTAWLEGEAGMRCVADQFYVNHRRLAGLCRPCRQAVFHAQAAYYTEAYPGRRGAGGASPLYVRAMERGSFPLAELAVRADRPLKLLSLIRQRLTRRAK